MTGRKGIKNPIGMQEDIVSRAHAGNKQCTLSREYVIMKFAIQSWLKGKRQI